MSLRSYYHFRKITWQQSREWSALEMLNQKQGNQLENNWKDAGNK